MKEIFVFGSNLAGIHGAGAAKTAYKKHGARWVWELVTMVVATLFQPKTSTSRLWL